MKYFARQSNIARRGFALPTVVIVSTALLILGMSVLQGSLTIRKGLDDAHWATLARATADAGVAYATSCIEQVGSTSAAPSTWWTSTLSPDKTCTGASTGASNYVSQNTNTSLGSLWRSSFSVSQPVLGADGISRTTVAATVQLQAANNTAQIVREYRSEKTIVIPPATAANLPLRAVSVSTGVFYTCVLATNSQVYCSGYNAFGQLGIGNTSNVSNPQAAFGIPSGLLVKNLQSSANHTCVVASDNNAYCAGSNGSGQLGVGDTTNRLTPNTKFNIPSGQTVTKLVTSQAGGHTCAIATNGELYCAGNNTNGEAGVGNVTARNTPDTAFNPPGTLTAIDADQDAYQTCTIASDYKAYCAGNNTYGQIGIGNFTNPQSTPATAFALNPSTLSVREIVSGQQNVCALASDNRAYCAGNNDFGQIGVGTTGSDNSPNTAFNIGSLTVQKIVIGIHYVCALASDQRLYCAGRDDFGQLGDGTVTPAGNTTPSTAFGLPSGLTARDVSAGYFHTCVLASDRQVYCAGNNSYGQLGNNTTASTDPTPSERFAIPAGLAALSVSTGYYHTCVLASDFKVYCGGNNNFGELGTGSTSATFSTPQTAFAIDD